MGLNKYSLSLRSGDFEQWRCTKDLLVRSYLGVVVTLESGANFTGGIHWAIIGCGFFLRVCYRNCVFN